MPPRRDPSHARGASFRRRPSQSQRSPARDAAARTVRGRSGWPLQDGRRCQTRRTRLLIYPVARALRALAYLQHLRRYLAAADPTALRALAYLQHPRRYPAASGGRLSCCNPFEVFLERCRPDLFRFTDGDVDGPLALDADLQARSADTTDAPRRDAGRRRARQKFAFICSVHGDDDARGALAEERDVRTHRIQVDRGAEAASVKTTLGECDGNASVRAVVRGLQQARRSGLRDNALQRALACEIQFRRVSTDEAMHGPQVFAAAELPSILPKKNDRIRLALECPRDHAGGIVDQADDADDRCRVDRFPVGLVVQADIPPGDRDIECATALRQPFDAFHELPHDF